MPTETWDVAVVGAGPAGLLAAARAAERGRRTLLLEKNRKPGAKILMSGGNRCNLTHDTDARGIVAAFGPPGRFLHSALSRLGPQQLIALVEAEGVATKVEPGGKVFPRTDRAADVLNALLRRLARTGATLASGEPLQDVRACASGFHLVTPRRTFTAAKVILATGGKSYPGCGTTGEGYRWAADLGHSMVPPHPALVPLTTAVDWVKDLKGVTIPDAALQVVQAAGDDSADPRGGESERPAALAQRRGSLLFTHFGLSGPAALDVSRAVSACPRPRRLELRCDFLPDVSPSQLETMLGQQAASAGKRQLGGLLDRWLPRRVAESLLRQAGLPSDRRAAEVSRRERSAWVRAVKHCAIPVTGTLGFEKAEVTAGGVALDEVDSRTLQSKRVPGLYIAGELLDLDGPIGGYNFQAAFSTGFLAGESV